MKVKNTIFFPKQIIKILEKKKYQYTYKFQFASPESHHTTNKPKLVYYISIQSTIFILLLGNICVCVCEEKFAQARKIVDGTLIPPTIRKQIHNNETTITNNNHQKNIEKNTPL